MSQIITSEQRAAWIAEAVAQSPPLSPEFIAELDKIPPMIQTRTTREHFEVFRRELQKPRRYRIHRLEDGIRTKIAGQKKSYLEPGRTFYLWKCNEEQSNLL